ncbi:hypothetical protein [Paraburkholderia kirstenboschensis]|uniref:Uncharacterized protein n=1 Tax=Paraburkholderia kirstenboschensis TaxID=1245436 RepID=A0ABZ0ENY3_9BURK|nr:hypothetical protein [Paraburkholderia kirstenboschensis]WOD18882.1 hypothetical protein RW095_40075 [Paraburkholderia kirstenboschensis]
MDNALSFQKKRNETTWLGGVPAARANCFAAWLPGAFHLGAARFWARLLIDTQDNGPPPALSPGIVAAGANAGEACSRGILLISNLAAIHG